MIIADRTFSNFKILAQRKFYHSISDILFKCGSFGWQANNDWNITFRSSTCYKVIITEKNDEVVDLHSSLMVGVARLISNSDGCVICR